MWFADRSTGRGTFGAHLGRAIVSNADFTAYVCDSASTVAAAVWVVRAVGRGIAVLDGVNVVPREGEVLGVFVFHFTMGNAIASPTVKCFRFV